MRNRLLLFSLMLATIVGRFDAAPTQAEEVAVCHAPEARRPVPRTLLLESRSAAAHLEHGDALGVCSPPEGPEATTLDARAESASLRVALARSAQIESDDISRLVATNPDLSREPPSTLLASMATCVDMLLAVEPVVGYAWALRHGTQVVEGGGGHARGTWESELPGLPMTAAMQLPVASVTKALQAAAVLRLLNHLGIDVDAPVLATLRSRIPIQFTYDERLYSNPFLYVAYFSDGGFVPRPVFSGANELVTFRHLLMHTSGYHDCYCREDDLLAQFVRGPVEASLNDEGHRVQCSPTLQSAIPGAVPSVYANSNYCLLELAVEALLGEPYTGFQRYVRREILEPIGIPQMFCMGDVRVEDRPDRTLTYGTADVDTGRPGYLWPSAYHHRQYCGAGNYVASARELLLVLSWLSRQQHEDPQLYDQMFFDCLPGDARCLGMYRSSSVGGTWWTHNGGIDNGGGQGSAAWIARFPYDVDGAVVINTISNAGRRIQQGGDTIMRFCFDQQLMPVSPPNPD